MDIVLIPCYYRPEFLSLCLEYLSKATGARDNKEYWICQDFRKDDNHRYAMQASWTKEVIENSPLPVRFIQRQPHSYSGNSYNTLEAYKEAYATDARYIHLVEEDCLVTPDYFLWHEAIQEKEDALLCSVAYRCIRNSLVDKTISSSETYFVSSRDYASIGVCWKRERLGAVVAHARPEYYAEMGPYLDTRFEDDRYSGWFWEQDGLIMRVLHEQKKFVVWPYVPRVFHIGAWGYHRPNGRRPDGQLAEKIVKVREIMYSKEMLKIAAPDFGDIEVVPREFPSWDDKTLYKVQSFD